MLIDEKHFYSHTHKQKVWLTNTGAGGTECVRFTSQSSYSWWMDSRYSWSTREEQFSQAASQAVSTRSHPYQWNGFLLLSASLLQPLITGLRSCLEVDWSQRKHTHTHTKLNIFPLISSMAWEEELEATGGQTHIRTSHQPRERLDSKPAKRS